LNVLFLILKAVTLFDIADRTRQVYIGLAMAVCLMTNALINITFLLISTIMKLIASAILVFKQMKVLCKNIKCSKKKSLQGTVPQVSSDPIQPNVIASPQPVQIPSSAPKKRPLNFIPRRKIQIPLFTWKPNNVNKMEQKVNEHEPQVEQAGQARSKVLPAKPSTDQHTQAPPGLKLPTNRGSPAEQRHRPLNSNKPMEQNSDLPTSSQKFARPVVAQRARDAGAQKLRVVSVPKTKKFPLALETRLKEKPQPPSIDNYENKDAGDYDDTMANQRGQMKMSSKMSKAQTKKFKKTILDTPNHLH
jgi:hypothetical protein